MKYLVMKLFLCFMKQYKLETFTESRSASWEQEPYRGQAVDKPCDGIAPPPLSVACQPASLFNNEVHAIEVPHTAVILVNFLHALSIYS